MDGMENGMVPSQVDLGYFLVLDAKCEKENRWINRNPYHAYSRLKTESGYVGCAQPRLSTHNTGILMTKPENGQSFLYQICIIAIVVTNQKGL